MYSYNWQTGIVIPGVSGRVTVRVQVPDESDNEDKGSRVPMHLDANANANARARVELPGFVHHIQTSMTITNQNVGYLVEERIRSWVTATCSS